MRGVQDPASSSAANDKALIDQLTQASRAAPSHAHNIDPAIAGVPPPSVPIMSNPADQGIDKKSGKRELSTSKRAAQNRAAQRAFRQRKEGHIKKLEEQVRDYGVLLEHFKRLQSENLGLRDYVIALQGRLIESQGDFPAPPMNIDLNAPRDDALPPAIQDALATHGMEGSDGGEGEGDDGAGAGGVSGGDAMMMDGRNESGVEVGNLVGSAGGGAVTRGGGPAQTHAAPTAPMGTVGGGTASLQASAAQATAVAKGRSRGRGTHANTGVEGSIEERTDPALK